MISSRYALGVLLLAVIALVPTVVHSYLGITIVDGLTVAAIPSSIAGFSSSPTERDARWGRQRFDSSDWLERRYTRGPTEAVLTAVRSVDFKRLYHHPELDLAYGITFERDKVVRLPAHPRVPVHVLRGDTAVALYVLYYDDGFIDDPIWFQIRTAVEALWRPQRPMTLIFIQQKTRWEGTDIANLSVTDVLLGAAEQFSAQASGTAGSAVRAR